MVSIECGSGADRVLIEMPGSDGQRRMAKCLAVSRNRLGFFGGSRTGLPKESAVRCQFACPVSGQRPPLASGRDDLPDDACPVADVAVLGTVRNHVPLAKSRSEERA